MYLDNIKSNTCVRPKQATKTDAHIHSSGNEGILTFFSKDFDPITHSMAPCLACCLSTHEILCTHTGFDDVIMSAYPW